MKLLLKRLTILRKWEKPIKARPPQAISIRLLPELIQKTKLLAAMHKTNNYQG